MNYENTLTAAFLVIGMIGLTAPTAAQPAQAQNQVQTEAQASVQGQTGLVNAIQKLTQQVQQLQDRVAKLEAKVNASAEASGQNTATGELNSKGQERKGPPEHAQNKNNMGSKVSTEAKSGDKKGIMASISAFLSGKGNDRAAEAVTQSGDRETTEEIQLDVQGEVEAGNNVTVVASSEGDRVVNATVKVNGETIGKTDANGKITVKVPETEEFEVEIKNENSEGEIEIKIEEEKEVETEAEAEAELNSETETENNSASSETSVETDAEVETNLN